MLRAILFSLATLVLIALFARSCGVTPAQMESRLILAELNQEEGRAYLQANRQRPGVIEFPSGLQIEWLAAGDGPVPTLEDWVVVHYRGAHLDGRVFEDSLRREEPVSVPVDRTITGWQQALLGLPVGSRVRLVIPPDLAYGTAGGGPIGPEETLLFELELLAITQAPEPVERSPWEHAVPGLVPAPVLTD